MHKVIILGGGGFLGTNIVKAVLKNSAEIIVFDYKLPENIIKGVKYYQGKLSDFEKIQKIILAGNIDTVLHCVSTIIPSSGFEAYLSDVKQVELPTLKLVDFCARKAIKFVFVSSGGTIYGMKSGYLIEDMPCAPISFYGLSKKKIEDIILFYHCRFNMPYLIIRPSNPYGIGQNLFGNQGLISVLFGKLFKNERAIIYGDGKNLRDFIYIDDFVFYVSELLQKGIKNEILNIGSGKSYSILQVIDIIQTVTNQKLQVVYDDARPSDVHEIRLDITRLNNLVPHKQIALDIGIKKYYEQINNSAYFLCNDNPGYISSN